ncbi:hypothetical protein QTO34_017723 [Cnephaeus nilssonii]|uniref:Alpha-N-acetylneuraminide alpha-2,8-sialyltransferase n=1 Tax=Cnephaeus nilssonii TaxID=3371016 RepID=A0AA40I1N4_CNENI|nr:hypothetical protein QTO34_017723 [Eptesicus nilssonii]
MPPPARVRHHQSAGSVGQAAWVKAHSRLPRGQNNVLCVFFCWHRGVPGIKLSDAKRLVANLVQQRRAVGRDQACKGGQFVQFPHCVAFASFFQMRKLGSIPDKKCWVRRLFLEHFSIQNHFLLSLPLIIEFQRHLIKDSQPESRLLRWGKAKPHDERELEVQGCMSNQAHQKNSRVGVDGFLFSRVIEPLFLFNRFQNLLWSRKTFVDNMKIYNHSYIYMPAFSMKTGTEPSLRVYYTLSDVGANQTVLFANPNFLRSIGKFWKSRGIHAKRLSTGLFLVSAALGLCEEVAIYGFWPFSVNMHEQPISHHYYDNVLPFSGFHAMPEEFLQLWYLHKTGALRMQLDPCEDTSLQPTS